MTWRDTFTVEEPTFGFPDMPVIRPKRIGPCGVLAPEDLDVCGYGEYCQRVVGHPGGHASRPSQCNRPHSHDDDHMVLARDFTVLARWS